MLAADALAQRLRRAADTLAVPLARAARAFRDRRGWLPFGFARLDDYARERLGRTGRWLRDQAALGDGLERLPGLADALSGADGGPPVGRVAALLISRVAGPPSLAAWVALARSCTVRELKLAVGRSRRSGSAWPVESSGDGESVVPAPDDVDRRLVRFLVPTAVRCAFDETLELHRLVTGGESTVASFVEALVAEAFAGPSPPDVDSMPLRVGDDRAQLEALLAWVTNRWRHLRVERPDPDGAPRAGLDALRSARVDLDRLDEIAIRAGVGDVAELQRQLRALIDLEDGLQRRLGVLLAEMGERGAWASLMFRDAGHYAEERLGMGRTSVADRMRLHRALGRFPVLRAAYGRGEVGFEAALLVLRNLSRGASGPTVEKAWVERAREATVKRLRDETRAVERLRLAEPRACAAAPLDDTTWHASLRRDPGTARERVVQLGELARALGAGQVFLRLRLPAWVGLLALLEDYVMTWDAAAASKRAAERIYRRDGWRCTAPGCTSRRNLEDHHVLYRSRGGGHETSNRICLCRFHHQRGEHGDLAACRGEAPLAIVWRLGKKPLGVRYLNERRL